MKKLYDLWVKYCPLPKLFGLNTETDNTFTEKPVKTEPKKTTQKVEMLAPYKLKRINKSKLTDLAEGYGLTINKNLTKNKIIDAILKYYNGEK